MYFDQFLTKGTSHGLVRARRNRAGGKVAQKGEVVLNDSESRRDLELAIVAGLVMGALVYQFCRHLRRDRQLFFLRGQVAGQVAGVRRYREAYAESGAGD